MSAATERELTKRIADLEGALQAIGKIVSDASLTPKRRMERVLGVLSMYDAVPEIQQPENSKGERTDG